jgi:HEAT repeat protein
MRSIDSILSDFRASDPVIRFSVLTRLENGKWSPEEIAEIRSLYERETDPATRLHLELVLRVVAETPMDYTAALTRLDEELKRSTPDLVNLVLLLKGLGPADRALAADLLREREWFNLPEDFLPFILRFFKRSGTSADLPAVLECCRHPNPRVMGAAIDVLESLSPEDLRGMLVPLLTNAGSGIQSQAIRLLYRWDPAEAITHFESFLSSDQPENKRAALFQAFFFPFPAIAASLLRFLSRETEGDLLRQAGRLFIINPDSRVPAVLMQILDASEGEKRILVQEILTGVVEFLSRSGVIPKSEAEILEEVRKSHRDRKIRQVLERCRIILDGEDEALKRSAVKKLRELEANGISAAGTLLQEQSARQKAVSLPEETEEVPQNESMQAQANAVTGLVAAALQDQTVFFAQLPAFLGRHSLEGVVQVIRELNGRKKALASEILEQLLFSVQTDRRRLGAAALGVLDFIGVRATALKAFHTENDPEILRLLLSVFEENLDESLVVELYGLIHGETGERKTHLDVWFSEQTRRLMAAGAVKAASPEAFLEGLATAAGERENRSRQPAPEYALSEIQKRRSMPSLEKSPGEATEKISGEFGDVVDPDPVIRFQALLRCSGHDWTEDRRREFSAQRTGPALSDPVTACHIDVVLARGAFRERMAAKGASPLALLEAALAAEPMPLVEFVSALENLARPDGKAALELLRRRSWKDLPVPVFPFLLSFFRKFGTPEDGPAIVTLCRHPDPRVVLTAIEALEKINPEELKPFLVPLLTAANPGVRSAGVRLLYKWDQDEALKHFEASLFSEMPEERRSILHFAYFLPFERIEPFLLRFLSIETDEVLLKKAGYLFQVNPRPEEPLRLVEVREASGEHARKLIGEILTGVIDALVRAGLVSGTVDEQLQNLRVAYREKKIFALLQQCRQGLEAKDPETRRSAAAHLGSLKRSGVDQASEILESAWTQETDAEVKQELGSHLSRPAGQKPVEAADEKARADVPQEPGVSLKPEGVPLTRQEIRKILSKGSEDDRCRLLRRIAGCPLDVAAGDVRKLLGDGSPAVVAAAVEALAVLDPEALRLTIPRLLEHPADLVKTATIEAFLRIDKRQALAFVEQMLGSAKPTQRVSGVFACGFFDFPAVRDLLLAFLAREEVEENLKRAWVQLRQNVDEAMLVQIKEAAGAAKEPKAGLLNRFCEEGMSDVAIRLPERFAAPEAVAEAVQAQCEVREAKRQAAPPPYALQRIKELRQKAASETERTGLSLLVAWWESLPWSGRAGLVLAAVLVVAYLVFPASSVPEQPAAAPAAPLPVSVPVSQRDKPLAVNEVRDIQGFVKEPFANGAIVILDGSDEAVFVSFPQPPRSYRRGDIFRAKIKVRRRVTDRFEAELLRLY